MQCSEQSCVHSRIPSVSACRSIPNKADRTDVHGRCLHFASPLKTSVLRHFRRAEVRMAALVAEDEREVIFGRVVVDSEIGSDRICPSDRHLPSRTGSALRSVNQAEIRSVQNQWQIYYSEQQNIMKSHAFTDINLNDSVQFQKGSLRHIYSSNCLKFVARSKPVKGPVVLAAMRFALSPMPSIFTTSLRMLAFMVR